MVAAFDRSSDGPAAPLLSAQRLKGWLLRNESLRGYFLLSPTLLVVFVLLVAPLVAMVGLSFATQEYVTTHYGFSLANYATIFRPSDKAAYFLGIPFYLQKPIYLILLFKSILISLGDCLKPAGRIGPLDPPVRTALTDEAFRRYLKQAIVSTNAPLRAAANRFVRALQRRDQFEFDEPGPLEKPLAFLLYSQTSVIITLAHAWAAVAILPIYVSLEKIDRSLLEAGSDLGDTRVQRFFRITLPLSMPGTIAASLLVFIPTVGDYITPTLVGSTNGIMIGNIVQSLFGKGGNWPMGAAVSIVAMAVITVLVCLFLWGVGRRPTSRAEGVIHRVRRRAST